LTIVHVDELVEVPEPCLQLRVHVDAEDPTKLRAYGCLTDGEAR
jgi:hypothetical protein